MRLTAKYRGFDPDFTKGKTYGFDVKQHRFGKKITIENVERRFANQKPGYDVEYFDLAEFMITWEIIGMVLTPEETTTLALRENTIVGQHWLDRV